MLKLTNKQKRKINYILLRIRFIPFDILVFILLTIFIVIVQTENFFTNLFKRK